MHYHKNIAALLILMTSLLAVSTQAAKPNLVLLPIDVSKQDLELEAEYGSALQEGLKKRYTVFYGAAVQKELEKEYSKIDCDAETCNQNIAIAFNGELLADSSVKKISGGYLLKLLISNVITSEIVESKTYPCRRCDIFGVVDALKLLGANGVVQSKAASNPVSELPPVHSKPVIKDKPAVNPWDPSNVGYGKWDGDDRESLMQGNR